MKTPQEIVQLMLQSDAFSHWLGIEISEVGIGSCTLSSKITAEMLNGFQIAHGGISFSMADSALAFASNSYGFQCVSIETSISHTKPAYLGDMLIAKCSELYRGRTTGIYEVKILNQNQSVIALFKGTVHISQKTW